MTLLSPITDQHHRKWLNCQLSQIYTTEGDSLSPITDLNQRRCVYCHASQVYTTEDNSTVTQQRYRYTTEDLLSPITDLHHRRWLDSKVPNQRFTPQTDLVYQTDKGQTHRPNRIRLTDKCNRQTYLQLCTEHFEGEGGDREIFMNTVTDIQTVG